MYSGAHWLLHPILELRLSNMYNICLDPDGSTNNQFLEMILMGLPLIAVTSATPVLDAVTYRFVSAWASTKRRFFTKSEEKMNIPMRTMIVSLIFTLNVFIGLLIVFFGAQTFSAPTWTTIVFVIGNFIIALRNPMICLFSHRVNAENRRCNGYKNREENRQREIQAAKRSRELRKRQRILFVNQSSDLTKYVSQGVQTEIN